MFNNVLTNSAGVLTNMIEKDPGIFMGPIDAFLGYILDFIFNFVNYITEPNSLGITIIIFTVIIRLLMVPSGIKSQKSMFIMRKIQPEMAKIKEKYGSTKDPELQRKMNAETQALYAKHGANPFGGCLPMFITFPIFMAMYYLLRQPFLFIGEIGHVYEQLALKLLQADNFFEVVEPIAMQHVPSGMEFTVTLVYDLQKAINKFSSSEWNTIVSQLQGTVVADVEAILVQKFNIETFLSLNLLDACGMSFPGILIPIMSASTQFLSSYYMSKINPPADQNAKSQQLIMNVVMPLFMGYITMTVPMGVGIYWVVGNLFMFLQQIIITKYLSSAEKKKEALVRNES